MPGSLINIKGITVQKVSEGGQQAAPARGAAPPGRMPPGGPGRGGIQQNPQQNAALMRQQEQAINRYCHTYRLFHCYEVVMRFRRLRIDVGCPRVYKDGFSPQIGTVARTQCCGSESGSESERIRAFLAGTESESKIFVPDSNSDLNSDPNSDPAPVI